MTQYIGNQEVLRTEDVSTTVVQAVLKGDTEMFPGLPEEEITFFNKDTFKELVTEEPHGDVDKLRVVRCRKPIAEIVGVLMNNAVKTVDLEYIFQNVLGTLDQAEKRQIRSVFGVSEDNQSVYQLKSELIKE